MKTPLFSLATIATLVVATIAAASSATVSPGIEVSPSRAASQSAQEQASTLRPSRPGRVSTTLVAEMGFVDPISHTVQFGQSGTKFDYVDDGGQDILFPTMRLSAEVELGGAHTFIFLYQPIDIRTRETLRRDLVVDEVLFPEGAPMDFRYGFDFYRASYLYDLWDEDASEELSFGAGLQLRDAVIDFTSIDGSLHRSNRGVGPVPLLKSRLQKSLNDTWWLGVEADGIYAPVKYFNGGKSDVEGAILDFSVRLGYQVAEPLGVFLNARYIGGGAEGTSDERGPGDGYTSNWLHFWSSTIGLRLNLEAWLANLSRPGPRATGTADSPSHVSASSGMGD